MAWKHPLQHVRRAWASFRQSGLVCFLSFLFFLAKTAKGVCRSLLQYALRPSRRRLRYSRLAGGVQTTPETARVAPRRCDASASEPRIPSRGQWVGPELWEETDEPPAAWDTLGARVNFSLVSSFISSFVSLIFRPSTPGPRCLLPLPIRTAFSGSSLSNKSTSSSFAFKRKLAELSHVLLKPRDLF